MAPQEVLCCVYLGCRLFEASARHPQWGARLPLPGHARPFLALQDARWHMSYEIGRLGGEILKESGGSTEILQAAVRAGGSSKSRGGGGRLPS
jgi:hypothetical protein